MWGNKRRKSELPALIFSRFPPYEITLPINWADNPFSNRQWQHNFFSLRWLPATKPFSAVKDHRIELHQSILIIDDYVRYNLDQENQKSRFFYTRLGDLTSGIRMPILTDYYLFLKEHPDEDTHATVALLLEQIKAELVMMMSDEFCVNKSNHLLGLDIGTMYAYLLIPDLDPTGAVVEFLETRLEDTLSHTFDSAGVVMEHSIHYQTYTAWLCTHLLDLYERTRRRSNLYFRLCKIISTTRKIVPFGIKPNKEYHLIGDTFQQPLVRYLRTFTDYCRKYVPDEVPRDETRVDQQDVSHHAMIASEAGFASFRFQSGQNTRTKTFHLYLTAGWHSPFHKQGDDASFSLYAGGGDLLIDPGYSDLKEAVEADFRSPWRHNTVVSPKVQWFAHKPPKPTGSSITGYFTKPGLAAVRCELIHLPRVVVTRVLVFIQPNFLCVLDRIQSESAYPFEQRFSFAPDAEVTPLPDGGFDIVRPKAQRMHWVPQGPDLPSYKFFDNFLLRDKGFRSEGAEMLPVKGLAFLAHGTDIRLHHLLCPAGRVPWDAGSFNAAVGDDGHVSIRFTWNMMRIEHDFRLQPFGKDESLIIREI